jgi:hypothetical protein
VCISWAYTPQACIYVYLMGVHLMGVYLTGMHPMGVHLLNVHLVGVHLMDLYLTVVDLSRSELQNTSCGVDPYWAPQNPVDGPQF